jgi:hypothetical protein
MILEKNVFLASKMWHHIPFILYYDKFHDNNIIKKASAVDKSIQEVELSNVLNTLKYKKKVPIAINSLLKSGNSFGEI